MSENLESRHFINGVEIRPKDADQIGLKIDWTADAQEAELNVDSILLENKAKALVLQHIDQYGIFEGIPYTYQIGNLSLDYFIELVENPTISGKGDSAIEVNLKRRYAIDKFWDDARGLSFESCNITHPIQTVNIPYLIVRDNQLEMLIMLSISTFTLTKALIEGIDAIQTSIAELQQAITLNASAPPSADLGDIIALSIKVASRIIYVAGLIIALIDMTKQIIELIFPPVRYFKASTVKELLTRGCQKLGYTFESSIIDNLPELTIQPIPLNKKESNLFTKLFTLDTGFHTKGYPTARDASISTLGKLLTAMEQMFNAKLRVLNQKVILERRDYWVLNSGLQITRTLNLQNVRENQWSYNSGDWWKRYYLHYAWDVSDLHTMDNIDALDCEYSTEPVSVNNGDLVSIKGLVDIALPFSFGIRKNQLTWVEKVALPFAKLSDSVVNFFGGNSNLESKVKGRIGYMMISQQYFSIPKLLFQTNGRQPSNYIEKIGANTIYVKYHAINQVKENFKRIYSESVPFSTQQFEALLENNYLTDQNGESLEILTFEWINESKTADITFAVQSNEGFNTKTILIDG